MHAYAHTQGALPSQMSWPPDGRNLDVFVAALALALLLWPRPLPTWAAWAFGALGLASLLNIGFTSMVSLTHPLRDALILAFEPGLELVARPPYVLLPGFLVQLALIGHLLLFRRLWLDAAAKAGSGGGEAKGPAGAAEGAAREMW